MPVGGRPKWSAKEKEKRLQEKTKKMASREAKQVDGAKKRKRSTEDAHLGTKRVVVSRSNGRRKKIEKGCWKEGHVRDKGLLKRNFPPKGKEKRCPVSRILVKREGSLGSAR